MYCKKAHGMGDIVPFLEICSTILSESQFHRTLRIYPRTTKSYVHQLDPMTKLSLPGGKLSEHNMVFVTKICICSISRPWRIHIYILS